MVVERDKFLVPRAVRFSVVDRKVSQLLPLPPHWVKPCLAQLVRALPLAGTLLHQHLGHQAALPGVQLPCPPFPNPCLRHWCNYHHKQEQQHGGPLTWHCHHLTGMDRLQRFSQGVSQKKLLPQVVLIANWSFCQGFTIGRWSASCRGAALLRSCSQCQPEPPNKGRSVTDRSGGCEGGMCQCSEDRTRPVAVLPGRARRLPACPAAGVCVRPVCAPATGS